MAKKEIGVALVGTKFMGKTHSNAYLKVGKFFDLPVNPFMHTVVGRDPVATKAFGEQWGWANSSTTLTDIIGNPEIGVVDVCTPNHMHKDISIAALEAGQHVACEKPLAGSLDDAREMLEVAKKVKRKAKTYVWFSYRGCPALALARQLVQEGKIGRIYHVRANYLQDWGGPDTPLLWRFKGKEAGSGAHGDINAHIIDAARFVTGDEITEICGAIEETFIKKRVIPEAETGNIKGGKISKTAKPKMGKSTVDDAVMFLARFKGGAIGSFEASRLATGNKNANRIEINGELGSVRWDFEDMNVLWYYNNQDDGERAGWQRIMVTDAANHPYCHAWWPDAHITGYEHGFINLASVMLDDISKKKMEVPMPDFADAYQVQRILHAAIVSAREKTWVPMKEIK